MNALRCLTLRILPLSSLLLAVTIVSVVPLVMPAYALWPHDTYSGNVALSTAPGSQHNPSIASDGAGGAILTWYDDRNQMGTGVWDIYAQRVSAQGTPLWTAGRHRSLHCAWQPGIPRDCLGRHRRRDCRLARPPQRNLPL